MVSAGLVLFAALAVLCSPVWQQPLLVGDATRITLTIDGSQHFQTLECLGVNASPWAATYSDLTPVLKQILVDMRARCWHVDPYGNSDWIASTDDLHEGAEVLSRDVEIEFLPHMMLD